MLRLLRDVAGWALRCVFGRAVLRGDFVGSANWVYRAFSSFGFVAFIGGVYIVVFYCNVVVCGCDRVYIVGGVVTFI